MSATGYIDSVYSGSGVDGKGLRCVVFFSGCNLRCPFCHNPETLYKQGKKTSSDELTQNLMRYKGYFRRGGVTVSGGEPFLQKEFFLALARSLREKGIHVCAETNGHIADAELIAACDAIICDVKNQESDDLSVYEPFLSECRRQGKEVQLTCVLVPEKNGTEQKIAALASLAKKYGIQKIKFLPFRELCEEKYKDLSLPFPYAGFREGEPEDVGQAEAIFAAELEKNG